MSDTELIEHPDNSVRLGSTEVDDWRGVLIKGNEIAGDLTRLIKERQLFTKIRDKAYVHQEGWSTAAACLGIASRIVWVEEREIPGVDGGTEFVARVESFRTSDGALLGSAEASCGTDERDWAKRTRQARRSMAQTRATSKVFRLQLSWVIKLAGFEPTPFEEIDGGTEPPHENPERNETAAVVQPRGERITAGDVNRLYTDWKEIIPNKSGTKDEFCRWCNGVVGRELNNIGEWTQAYYAACVAIVSERMGDVDGDRKPTV